MNSKVCLFVLLIGSLIMLTKADDDSSPRYPDCSVYRDKEDDYCATLEENNVCGESGKTYRNECELCIVSRNTPKLEMITNDGPCKLAVDDSI
ncbi:turripeptide Pal9.2-like [Protopterus annectens]|uniref:turripeptide Pal9.2-like n=1 Tax=Protopterus annectens TaxID=7888 RepID=UPI001CFA914E|nr:turripeptide Pal9.2-like [Protopterus annectens]